jgi:hypothetical protein
MLFKKSDTLNGLGPVSGRWAWGMLAVCLAVTWPGDTASQNSLSESQEQLMGEIAQLNDFERSLTESPDLTVYLLHAFRASNEIDETLKESSDKLVELLMLREQLLYTVTENSPAVNRLNHNIGVQFKLLVETISARREVLTDRLSALSGERERPGR